MITPQGLFDYNTGRFQKVQPVSLLGAFVWIRQSRSQHFPQRFDAVLHAGC
jgi:hypothetical protein